MKRIKIIFALLFATVVFSAQPSHAVSADMFCDMLYPIGSYIETTDASFNPNTAWTGTWKLETSGLVHVSAGENYTVNGANGMNGDLAGVKDGGVTDNIVPLHTHSFPARGVSSDGGPSHNHSYSWYNHGCIPNGGGGWSNVTYGSGDRTGDFWISTDGSHSHTFYLNATTTNEVGETDESVIEGSNMMPYKCVYRWKRIS